ncbi:hypothetical protein L1987_43034 [Smallanthus sonchifolius]|uniref:Uncharacterized protein n=1 Tax=Smallanthus sonchifolius TaxID=185202 RepID=A0ACB9GL95_9ASTR|nr:hypothetical protein L1987_43034 [Smallanthus sonchifolius]
MSVAMVRDQDATTALVVSDFDWSGEIEEVQEEIDHALMAKDSAEKNPVSAVIATSSGGLGFDASVKASGSECISLSVPMTVDDKKNMLVKEMAMNKKEMVMEVLADNPCVPAKV